MTAYTSLWTAQMRSVSSTTSLTAQIRSDKVKIRSKSSKYVFFRLPFALDPGRRGRAQLRSRARTVSAMPPAQEGAQTASATRFRSGQALPIATP